MSLTIDTCLTPEELHQVATSAASSELSDRAGRHVASCPSCREALEQYRSAQAYFEEMREGFVRTRSLSVPVHFLSPEAGSDSPPAVAASDTDSAPGPDEVSIPGYRILREIHRGGQGVVYEAIQHSTNRTVAVKVLLDSPHAGLRARWRFEREVQLVAALRHPHIVVIHDSGIASGRYYYAMDYVRGQPLDTHARLAGLPTRRRIELFQQVCDAVACAHRRGVIHRDLKPSNILVSEAGAPCVLDFGLAKMLGEDGRQPGPAVSMPGSPMGTLRYMSPEQTTGDHDAVDTRSDVYSLGVILFELLTGEPPYRLKGDPMACLQTIRDQDPPRPSRLSREVNSELDAIILKCLSKEPQRRYGSAGELADDLCAFLEGRPVCARSASSIYVIRKIAMRHSVETLATLAVICTVIGVGFYALDQFRQARRARAAQAVSDRAAAAAGVQLEAATSGQLLPLHRQLLLPWFLLEWHQGRSDEARRIQGQLSSTSAEYRAMAFLLDPKPRLDKLLGELPPQSAGLAYFVAGERAFKEGRRDEAVALYHKSLDVAGNSFFQASAKARLARLEPSSQPAAAAEEESP